MTPQAEWTIATALARQELREANTAAQQAIFRRDQAAMRLDALLYRRPTEEPTP